MRKALAILVGLLIAAFAEFVGIMLAGAGHGWVAPASASLILFLAYPATLWRWTDPGGGSARADGMALMLGAVASLLVLVDTIAFEWEYFRKVVAQEMGLPLVILWILLWSGWLYLTAANMGRRDRLRADRIGREASRLPSDSGR